MKNNGWKYEKNYYLNQQKYIENEIKRVHANIDTYMYSVLHELKTPVREIELYVEFIEGDNKEKLLAQSFDDLQSIRRVCNSVMDIIMQMTEYSKAGLKVLEENMVDMAMLIRQCFNDIMKMIPEKCVELEIDDIPIIVGDLFLIKMMIMNIISNSVKFTNKSKNAKIKVYAKIKKNEIEYCFCDNGIGFDMKYASHIFEPFQRLHTDKEYEGSGIGLATVKRIAQRFGGNAQIHSELNKGCEVKICLPKSMIETKENNQRYDRDKIKIGIIGDFTGKVSNYEQCKLPAYKLAMEEINKSGGILGKEIQLIIKDDQSNVFIARNIAEYLVEYEHVDVIMGSTLSTSREAIRAIADKNKTIYIDNQQTEGGVSNHYTFCISAGPEQQISGMMEYLIKMYGRKCYIVAPDYNYGVCINEWIKHITIGLEGEIVGTEFINEHKSNFNDTIDNILQSGTDILFLMCVFDANQSFYKQWYERGLNYIPIATTVAVAQSRPHIMFKPPIVENVYVMASFLENLDTEQAKKYVEKYRSVYNENEVPYMGMESETVYTGMYLYKKAVELAGTTEVEAVIKAFESGKVSFCGPGGEVTVRGEDHQTYRDMVLFRVDKNHNIHEIMKKEKCYSDYVEKMVEQYLGIKGGIKALGVNAPNIHYNLLLNKFY
jgi:urea ABC transporter substrate-binding protein